MKTRLSLSILFFVFLFDLSFAQFVCSPQDSLFWDTLKTKKGETLAKTWENVAITFLGNNYVAHTLETNNDAETVVNFSEVDCTTYLEDVLAVVRALHQSENEPQLADVAKQVEFIRYRDGKRNGYTSRLHYFTEWLVNNEKKGLIKQVNGKHFIEKEFNLNFMSKNRKAYQHLADDLNFEAIQILEKQFKPELPVLPKSKIMVSESDLQHGDIIALVTSIKGLDVTHTGFIYKKKGISYLLHASSVNKEVEISAVPLEQYLQKSKSTTGILVYRLVQ